MTLPVLPLFLLMLIGLPLGELYVLIKVGGTIGAFPTIYLVVLTAVIGVWLVRRQGLSILSRVHTTLDRGEVPAIELVEGALVLGAGFALLIPGFVSDAAGFALLIPPFRHWLVRRLVAHWRVEANGTRAERRQRQVIDGDWTRLDDEARTSRDDLPRR